MRHAGLRTTDNPLGKEELRAVMGAVHDGQGEMGKHQGIRNGWWRRKWKASLDLPGLIIYLQKKRGDSVLRHKMGEGLPFKGDNRKEKGVKKGGVSGREPIGTER